LFSASKLAEMSRVPFLCFPSVLAFLTLAACAPSLGHKDLRQTTAVKSDYTMIRNVIYTPPGWPQAVPGDLYLPRSTGAPAPAVLLVHGGGWTGKDGRWQMNLIARKLVKRGYVVLNVTYRLAPEYIYPAPLEDLQQAVRWMRANAAEHGIDPARIATFGYSAGGYLASLTGLIEGPEDSRIRAIVAGAAPSDLTLYSGGILVPQFLGGSLRDIPLRFHEASRVNYVTRNSPPMFIYHSTGDELVPPDHPLAMVHALAANGVHHETYWLQGRGHVAGFLLPGGSVDAAMNFLDRQMR
jgi:acetyl esterase/lipase